jgi:tetratricopeptide (TPR) repeat protein
MIAEGWCGFGVVHQFASLDYQRGNYERSHRLLTEALQESPQSAVALSNLGLVLQAMHRPRDALENSDRAILLDPGLAKYLLQPWHRSGRTESS